MALGVRVQQGVFLTLASRNGIHQDHFCVSLVALDSCRFRRDRQVES